MRRWESNGNPEQPHYLGPTLGGIGIRDLEAEHQIYDDDVLCEYPQSVEKIRGRHNLSRDCVAIIRTNQQLLDPAHCGGLHLCIHSIGVTGNLAHCHGVSTRASRPYGSL